MTLLISDWHRQLGRASRRLGQALERLEDLDGRPSPANLAACDEVVAAGADVVDWIEAHPCPDPGGGDLVLEWTALRVEQADAARALLTAGDPDRVASANVRHLELMARLQVIEAVLATWRWRYQPAD